MSVRHDMACKKCEKTFVIWSDDPQFCPLCRSKRIFKVFLTPPAVSTGNVARIENLAEQQINAAGLSNYTNVGGTPRRTRRTDPKQLEAIAAAKANNIPMETGPAMRGIDQRIQQMREQYKKIGATGVIQSMGGQGKTQVTSNPRGPGALVNGVLQRAKQVAPLARMGERIYAKDAKEESAKLAALMKR